MPINFGIFANSLFDKRSGAITLFKSSRPSLTKGSPNPAKLIYPRMAVPVFNSRPMLVSYYRTRLLTDHYFLESPMSPYYVKGGE